MEILMEKLLGKQCGGKHFCDIYIYIYIYTHIHVVYMSVCHVRVERHEDPLIKAVTAPLSLLQYISPEWSLVGTHFIIITQIRLSIRIFMRLCVF